MSVIYMYKGPKLVIALGPINSLSGPADTRRNGQDFYYYCVIYRTMLNIKWLPHAIPND